MHRRLCLKSNDISLPPFSPSSSSSMDLNASSSSSENPKPRIDRHGVVEPTNQNPVSFFVSFVSTREEEIRERNLRPRSSPEIALSSSAVRLKSTWVRFSVMRFGKFDFLCVKRRWRGDGLDEGREGGGREREEEGKGEGGTNRNHSYPLLSRPSQQDLSCSCFEVKTRRDETERCSQVSHRRIRRGRGKDRNRRGRELTLPMRLCDPPDQRVFEQTSGVLVPSDFDEGGWTEGGVGREGETELFG